MLPCFHSTFYRTLPPKPPIISKISHYTSLQNLKTSATCVASTPLPYYYYYYYYYYILSYYLSSIFFINAHVVVLLFDTVIYVFLLLRL